MIFPPSYLKSRIPKSINHLYGNRRENVLEDIYCRTSKYRNSFFPDTIKSWNNIGVDLRGIASISLFKKKLFSLIRPEKKFFFGIHDPRGIKNIIRFRLNLSQLKSHKMKQNFLDTSSEICDRGAEPENTAYVFLTAICLQPIESLVRIQLPSFYIIMVLCLHHLLIYSKYTYMVTLN